MSADWCKANYEKSVTSRAWGATPYDAGWEGSRKHGEDLPASAELRAIFDEEMALGTVPPWAEEIIRRMIGPLPMCGHYAFPLPIVETCKAIGSERAPAVVHGCYTADRARKVRMACYAYCLDAWLQEAPLEAAQAELAMRDGLGKDWPRIAEAAYQALGTPTRPKRMAVHRLLHRLRWWLKTLVWEGDRRDQFQLDAYLGDARGDEAHFSAYGNPPFGDPYFEERKLPNVKRLDKDVCEMVPQGRALIDRIESTWLCAPKVFRYLERIVIEIGAVGTGKPPKTNVSILQCEDTYPDGPSHKAWYDAFMAALAAWLNGDASARSDLGEPTPVKHWLARILRHKLKLYETHDPFGNLVGAQASGKRGTKLIE